MLTAPVSVSAAALKNNPEAASVNVPQLHINTVNGNGASLKKEDGYTDAKFSADGGQEEHIIVKVRGNSTAMTAKKSFTFKFDKKKELLDYPTPPSKKSLSCGWTANFAAATPSWSLCRQARTG